MTVQVDQARYGKWANAIEQLVSYRYLGCRSVVVDAEHATGSMRLRSDMRWSAGLLGAPLAIAMLDTAGINIDRIRFGALTHVALRIHEAGEAVDAVRIDGEVARIGQRAIFTECAISDVAEPSRVIAHGTADWVNMGEVAPGFTYTDPSPGVPDQPPMPPLYQAYHIERGDQGSYRIPELRPEIGDQLLHHGPILVGLEAHATDLADQAAGGEPLRLSTFDLHLLRGGTRAPFLTRDRGSGRRGDTVWSRTEFVDDDGRGQVISRMELVFHVASSAGSNAG